MSHRPAPAFDETRARAVLRDLLLAFGEDPDSPELAETPARVAEFWKERLAGAAADLAAELQPLPGDLAPVPVILEHIPFVSTCEHHLAPFAGHATSTSTRAMVFDEQARAVTGLDAKTNYKVRTTPDGGNELDAPSARG